MTIAGKIAAAWRRGNRAYERCIYSEEGCGGWTHDPADHTTDALRRFFDERVGSVEEGVVIEGISRGASVVTFNDGSRGFYTDDALHPEKMGVLRGSR